jgi:glycosyltransferase involved in cell wall biosynthesis
MATNLPSKSIWFWQLIVSPHMGYLAVCLARLGFKVTYVAERGMSLDRASQGWIEPSLDGVDLVFADSKSAISLLVRTAPVDSVHITEGMRANRKVTVAQREISKRGLRQWVILETIRDQGLKGFIKRCEYSRLFRSRRKSLEGLLAIGHLTSDWIVERGMCPNKVYPFAYFLPDNMTVKADYVRNPGVFRFIFVGQLISRKRVNWLINILSELRGLPFELWIVGQGALESDLKILAQNKLGDRVKWLGTLAIPQVPEVMAQADCLVLPSVHDGWGAVISEALMVGTPVICSDACGAAGVVKASGSGGVFRRDRFDELQFELNKQLQSGSIDIDNRIRIASWARALDANAGARYLINIFDYSINGGIRPSPPWQKVENE